MMKRRMAAGDAPRGKKAAAWLRRFSLARLLPLGGPDEHLCFVLDACAGAEPPLSGDPPPREERAAP